MRPKRYLREHLVTEKQSLWSLLVTSLLVWTTLFVAGILRAWRRMAVFGVGRHRRRPALDPPVSGTGARMLLEQETER